MEDCPSIGGETQEKDIENKISEHREGRMETISSRMGAPDGTSSYRHLVSSRKNIGTQRRLEQTLTPSTLPTHTGVKKGVI